jgi:hypothetical protein
MAVIYETKEDFEKAKLNEQAKDLQLKASHEGGFGMALIGLNWMVDHLSQYSKNNKGIIRFGGNILGLFGLVETVKSFFTASKAHDREHELERMGPQTFVLPRESFVGANILEMDAPTKSFAKTIQPTGAVDPRSLFEHAEKPSCCDKSI